MIRIALLMIIISNIAYSESLLLHVKVNKQKYSDYSPSCESEGCVNMSSWYIYHAKVLDVIEGEYLNKKIKFVVLQHAEYIKEYVKDVYVVVEEHESKEFLENFGTQYYSNGIIKPFTSVCFPKDKLKTNSQLGKAPLISNDEEEYCYSKEHLDSIDDELNN
jgi:hypothetical protein